MAHCSYRINLATVLRMYSLDSQQPIRKLSEHEQASSKLSSGYT